MVTAIETQERAATTLQCMEIWGGNEAVDDAISVPGIDAIVHSRPHAGSGQGGDIYFVSVCGAGAISRFVLADVAGHGDSVGDLATKLRRIMRKNINNANPSQLAVRLNDEFGEVSDDGRFATALVMTYFAPSDHLIVTNAGHPSPLWYQASSKTWSVMNADDGRIRASGNESVGARNLPLGIIDGTEYQQFVVPLGKDDIVVAYTDSLIEASNAQGVQLGEAGLLGLVREIDTSDVSTIGTRIESAVAAFRDGAQAEDDLTVLVLSHNAGSPAKQGLAEKIRVLGRMVGLGG